MPTLNVHLDGTMFDSARAGTFRLMAVLARAVTAAGWSVHWRRGDEPADPAAYTLVHMRPPPTARSLVLRRAPAHAPDFAAYVLWFLRQRAIDAGAATAGERILRGMRKGGWPI